MLNYNEELETIWDFNKFYHFNFKESPLFISFYELIDKVKQHYAIINNNSQFIVFNQYIETLPELKKKFDVEYLEMETLDNQLTGFSCTLHPDTVKKVFDLMVDNKPKPQIEGKLEDFQAIFASKPTPIKKPLKWLVKHNKKPNKTALFTFIKMMLELDKVPIEIIKKANQLFQYGTKDIFPNKYYPSEQEQKSSIVTHFKQVKDIIKKTRPA